MKTAEQIRPMRLAQLVKEHGGVVGVAAVLKRSSPQVSQWVNQSIEFCLYDFRNHPDG